jgi:hypothetical protein
MNCLLPENARQAIVDDFEKPFPTAAMLDVWPPGLANAAI